MSVNILGLYNFDEESSCQWCLLKKICKNIDGLKAATFNYQWEDFEKGVTKKLVCSLSRRCAFVIVSRGTKLLDISVHNCSVTLPVV